MDFVPFLKYLASERRFSPLTCEAYANDLGQFDQYVRINYEVTSALDIRTAMIKSWLASLMEDGYQVTSIHRKLSSLQSWLRHCQRIGVIEKSPAKGIQKPRKPQRLPGFVDEKGMKKILETPLGDDFESRRTHLIVTLFYETGIRLSELMSLSDRDIDFYQKQITVTGKRNKMRIVPIGNELISLIRSYVAERADITGIAETPALFVTATGKKISKYVVYNSVKSYLSNGTTMKKKSPHILRHTFATHMLNNGADLNIIKEILGHSSLAATQVYTHNSIEKLKGIHQQMHPRKPIV